MTSPTISVWSTTEAHALREAMRMSIDDFAGHLAISRRGVAAWRGRDGARLRWDVQRKLDDALAAAPAAVKERMARLLSERSPGPIRAQTGPSQASRVVAALGELLVPAPRASGAAPPALIRLELRVARVKMAYQEARYGEVADALPALSQALAEARADARAHFPLRIRRLAAAVHQSTTSLLLKLGDLPLAMLAAERAAGEAEASGDPLVVAASARGTVQALQRSGHPERAAAFARDAAEELTRATGLDGPRPLSAYGALLLSGAVAAACAADRLGADQLLTDAARAAKTLGGDGNFGWTAFGPTNVALHRADIALQLADPPAALQVLAELDPGAILQAERLATYHVDTARAFQAIAQPGAAVSALKRAYAVAPEELRLCPQTRQLTAELARSARGPQKARATRFAEQVLSS